jgi:hypothetical protein
MGNLTFSQVMASAGSLFILLVIILVLIGGSIFVAIGILGLAIVPLTALWGLFTGQSYARVCDNSEILYKLNQIGKYAWTFAIAGVLVAGIVTVLI